MPFCFQKHLSISPYWPPAATQICKLRTFFPIWKGLPDKLLVSIGIVLSIPEIQGIIF